MYKRKLLALNYQQPDNFNVTDENQFRNMVLWLEDQKIRHYKIEDRVSLRDVQSAQWTTALELYLSQLNCPWKADEKSALIDWLLGYAVRLEYGDNVEKYKAVTPESVLTCRTGVSGQSSNPLDSINFDDPNFKAGITSLCMMLQIPPHSDHLQQLKAICLLVKEKLSKEAIEAHSLSKDKKKPDQFPLDKMELGFEAGDNIMNETAKILRLLHIKELRELQTQINVAIVAVQAITANPKTDSRLGKVGW